MDLIQLSFSPSFILQWKTDMEDILALATHDTDQWVSTIAEILQSYPSTGCLNLELDNSNSTFMEILTDLSKVGEWHSPDTGEFHRSQDSGSRAIKLRQAHFVSKSHFTLYIPYKKVRLTSKVSSSNVMAPKPNPQCYPPPCLNPPPLI